MGLFDNWFKKNTAPKSMPLPDSSGLDDGDSTMPMVMPQASAAKPAPAKPPVLSAPDDMAAGQRKEIRLERREHLYAVVREAMARAGVLSSSYKYKVLSLDAQGRQYLIMIDLARAFTVDQRRLGEIEVGLAQSAKARYDILVTAVYWRINEHVSAGAVGKVPVATPTPTPTPIQTPPRPAAVAPAAPTKTTPPKEGLLDAEMEAFKRALAAGAGARSVAIPSPPARAPGAAVVAPVKTVRPAPPARDFEDTEVFSPDPQISPLGSTQYGELR